MRIHAVKTGQPANIQAALASPEVRSISAPARKAGLDLSRPIKFAKLDAALANSGLSIGERISIKSALDRVGMIDWDRR